MPANLTPEYKAAEARFRTAVTREEKLAALEEMLRVLPKHKGTDKLQADLRARISKLKRQPAKKGAHTASHRIPREGAGQVALVGPPNSGKSSLVALLTHADPPVAEYPLTTREATPGMMPYQDVGFQLLDLPPLNDEHVEPWVYDLVRAADLVWLVLSIDRPLEGFEMVERLLGGRAIGLVPVTAAGPAEPRPGWSYLRAFMVVTGMDLPGARDDLAVLDELLGTSWPKLGVSAVTGAGCETLGRVTFDALGIIRVYTKEPGDEADRDRPFTLPRGATVGDLARTIHQDFAETFKFARVWGASALDGQRVAANHELAEGDIVELHV
jgi:ribosome-interacting GTPase 1